MSIEVRTATPSDTDAVYRLVAALPPLEQHSWYTYWDLFSNFGNSCFVAEDTATKRPVGFVTSHPVMTTNKLEWFGWQFGITPEHRGTGLLQEFQDRMIDTARESSAVALRTTTDLDNAPSLRALERLAVRLGSEVEQLGLVQTPQGPEMLHRIPFS